MTKDRLSTNKNDSAVTYLSIASYNCIFNCVGGREPNIVHVFCIVYMYAIVREPPIMPAYIILSIMAGSLLTH